MKNHSEISSECGTGKDAEFSAARYIKHLADKFTAAVLPHIQYIEYNGNLSADELQSIQKIRYHMYKFHVTVNNVVEVFCKDDISSSVNLAEYNAERFLTSIVKHAAELLNGNNIYISLSCDESCRCAVFDARRMSVIMYNVISNAIIHNRRSEKHVDIKAVIENDNLVVEVRDNGNGIPASVRNKVFADDRRFDKSMVKLDNSGMGLYAAKACAADMNGRICNPPTSEGAVIRIIIPQESQAGQFREVIEYEPTRYEVEKNLADAILCVKFNENIYCDE